jgi:hypothetical protein
MGPPAKLRREPRFRNANWFWHWFLVRYDFWAIPMPWRVVHVLPDKLNSEVLRQHERVHYEQMEREGIIVWHLKYLVFLLKFGYRNNPYEVEAYNRFGG